METNPKHVFSLSLSASLGAWDLWSGHGHAKLVESFTTRRDGHSAELAGATANSDGKRRTIGDRRRYDVSPEEAVARLGRPRKVGQ